LRRLGVERRVEVGTGAASAAPAGLPVAFLGRLDAPALHRLLLRSRFGPIDYPASLLGKSSVFGVLAAHGMVVLNARPFDADADGLRQGHHYVSLGRPDDGQPQPLPTAAMAAAVRQWYLPHASPAQARDLAALLAGHPPDTAGAAARTSAGRSAAHAEVSHG
jgi:hypothetical protein